MAATSTGVLERCGVDNNEGETSHDVNARPVNMPKSSRGGAPCRQNQTQSVRDESMHAPPGT